MIRIVVATHNRRTLVARTVSALAAQEYPIGGVESARFQEPR